MADNLTSVAERLVLDWLAGKTIDQPVGPLVMRLMAANGNDETLGTEVIGDVYDEVPISFGPAATASDATTMKNSQTVNFPAISTTSATSVAGFEIWDSNVPAMRIFWHAYGTPVNVPAGQAATISVNSLVVGLT